MTTLMKKISSGFQNPIYLLGVVVILLSLILLIATHFQVPSYYTDRELANNIAQTVYSGYVREATKHLLNPTYNMFNTMFHIWGWLVALLTFCLIFKIKKFEKIKELDILNQKRFVYPWINLSYIVFSVCFVCTQMIDLEKYVYNGSADSMGIPFFTMIGLLIYFSAIYYPTINILAFITYNTKIKRTFYGIVWGIIIILMCAFTADSFRYKFSYFYIIEYISCLIWFALSLYAIGYTKTKI